MSEELNFDFLDKQEEEKGPINTEEKNVDWESYDPDSSGDEGVDFKEEKLDWNAIPESDPNYIPMIPKSSGIVSDASGDPSYLTDFVLSAGVGLTNGVEETLDAIGQITGETGIDSLDYVLDPNNRVIPRWYKPETGLGVATEGISRFLGGFGVAGKMLKGVGWADKANKAGDMVELTNTSRMVRSLTAGGLADFFVFDPVEGRLTDMLAEFDNPMLDVVVVDYLQSEDNDSVLEGRLKNVLEGMMIGSVIEGVMLGIRAYKAAKNNPKDAEKIYNKAEKDIAENNKRVDEENLEEGGSFPKTKKQKENIVESNPAIDTKKATKKFRTSEDTAKKDSETFLSDIFNLGSFSSGRHVLKTIEDAIRLFDDDTLEYLSKDVLRNETAIDLAKLMSRNPEEVLKALPKDAAHGKQAVIRMLASKMVLQQLSKQVGDLAAQVRKLENQFGRSPLAKLGQTSYRHWTPEAIKVVKEYERAAVLLADSSYYLKEQIRNAARLTQAGRIKMGLAEGKLKIEKLVDDIEQFKGDPLNLAKKMEGHSGSQLIDDVSKSKGSLAIETFNSLYVNSLLSSPWTNLINITAGIYEAGLRPLEMAIGATARGDWKTAKQAFSIYSGMMQSYKDIWRMTKLSFNQGDAILDRRMQTIESKGRYGRTISARNYEMTPGSTGATAVDWIGNFLELPGRFLTSGDELLKQANYRGRIHQNSVMRMLDEGVVPKSDAWAKGLEDDMARAFSPDGSAAVMKNPMAKDALEYAREASFTNALKGGSYSGAGENIEKFFNATPYLRFMAPFIRTPTNLWRHVVNRFPGLGAISKQNSEIWAKGDPRSRADIVGRQLFGTATVGIAYGYATSDVVISNKNGKEQTLPRITGRGPMKKEVRDLLLATGWQPYSILINDGTEKKPKWTYKQYNRTDPRFFYFGLVADVVEINKLDPNNNDVIDFGIGIMQSIMHNITDKTYTKGISDIFEVMDKPDGPTARKWLGNMTNNIIPYSGMRRFITAETNPTAYEIRGVLDSFLSTSGFTDSLEPKRDWKGEPIYKATTGTFFNDNFLSSVLMSPSLIGRESEVKDTNDVIFKLAKLHTGVTRIEKDSLHKDMDIVNFKNKKGQSFLDAWREQVGKVRLSGMKIEQYMKVKMQSSLYQNAGQGTPDDKGGKEYLVGKWYTAFKDKARFEMLKKGHLFKNEEGKRVSDFWKKTLQDKYKYFRDDAPNIKDQKKRQIDKLIGF